MGSRCTCCRGAAGDGEGPGAAAFAAGGSLLGSATLEQQFLDTAQKALERQTTHADPSVFETPAKPVGVSGGTAAFYAVKYSPGSPRPAQHSERHWIGKDLARAEDELSFYERARRLAAEDPGRWRLLRWAFDYGGVAEVPCLVDGSEQTRKQLLLRNLFDGAEELRMLDVKIGAVTAVGGWQGKSHFRATRQKIVDQATNSATEGYRAEGFEAPPPGLVSLLEQTGGKRKHRVALQRLCAADFFRWWTTMPPEEPPGATLSGSETAARALRHAVQELISIVAAAAAVEVPQQWIGSSAAIAFDAAARPSRIASAGNTYGAARINIFDWGRSELGTLDMFEALSQDVKMERAKHWAEWVSGIMRLAFESARAYRRTYCPANGRWRSIRLRVWSFQSELQTVASVTSGTEIGTATLPLASIEAPFEITLHGDEGLLMGTFKSITKAHVKAVQMASTALRIARDMIKGRNIFKEQRPTLTISVRGPLSFPHPSDLAERWVVCIHNAKNLPKTEVATWCNPVVTVSLIDEHGAESVQQTRVRMDNANPVWDESLEFCTATPYARSAAALLPPELVSAAPAEDVTEWDLAAEGDAWRQAHEGGGDYDSTRESSFAFTGGSGRQGLARALLSFKSCFFRADLPPEASFGDREMIGITHRLPSQLHSMMLTRVFSLQSDGELDMDMLWDIEMQSTCLPIAAAAVAVAAALGWLADLGAEAHVALLERDLAELTAMRSALRSQLTLGTPPWAGAAERPRSVPQRPRAWTEHLAARSEPRCGVRPLAAAARGSPAARYFTPAPPRGPCSCTALQPLLTPGDAEGVLQL